MANEFKIKKGLIVTGASGGTVVDIQGSQGQLFSVTDNLSGSIFAVSDISGVPIFDVNSSGLSTFDGSLNVINSAATVAKFNRLSDDGEIIRFEQDNGTDGAINSLAGRIAIGSGNTGIFFDSIRQVVTPHNITTNGNSQNLISLGRSLIRFKDIYLSGKVVAGTGATDAATINAYSTAVSTGLYSALRVIEHGSASSYWDIGATNAANTLLNFYHNGNTTPKIIFTHTGGATFAGKATSSATAASDGSTTLTTKSYVDGLVTGVPVYKGTWAAGTTGVTSAAISSTTITLTAAPTETIAIGDVVTADGITAAITVTAVGSQTSVTVNASVTIASGVTVTFSPEGGYPDLTLAAAKVLGNYYIVSTAGSAAPNGSGVEPDSWAVGDWCIFSDVTPGAGTDLWQRIDNSSVISGAGTGKTIPLWEGATNAVSETLTDSPLTVSGTDTTFAGRATFQSAVADRPQLPGGFLAINTGDADADIWGVSQTYYPSNPTTANAWGLKWASATNQFQWVGAGSNVITFDLDQGNIVTLGNVTGGYGFFNNESLTEDLRVGGIYANLGLYVADTYDMQFAIGTTASKFKFTLANVEKFVITANGDVTANGSVSATQFEPTNIVTNKVVKFDGTSLNDSNITDTGSLITLGTNATITGNVVIQSTIPKLSFTDLQQDDWDIINDNGEFKFLCSTGTGVALQLNTDNSAAFTGLVSGITPTAAANFTTKAYVDSFNPPTGTTQFFNQSSSYNNSTPGVTGYGNIVMDTSVSYYDTGKNVVVGTRGMVWTGKHYIFTDHSGNTAKFYNNNFDLITNPEASTITLPSPSSGGSNPHGAAWDGRYLYCINYSPMKILAYDLDNGTTTATVVSETDISSYSTITYGIEYAEGHLYTCADGKVSKFKVEGKTITHVFTSGVILGTIDAQAITYDGSYLWFTQNGQNAYKVSLDCVLVATITTGLPPNNIGWAWNGQNVATVNYSTGDVYVLNTAETRFDTEEFLVMGGNVGIGETSPAKKLHVKESTTATYAAYIENTIAGGDYLAMIGDAGDNVFEFDSGGTGGEAVLKMYSDGVLKNQLVANGTSWINGNVAIGATSSTKKLTVNGSFKLGTNAYIEYGGVYPYTITTANTAAVGNLVFSAGLGSTAYESRIDLQGTNTAGVAGITLSTASTARMVVTADGDVGIGTSTPNAKLDIQGTQGQLFSVTDDLSGSIFAVADISGVPIFDVNSSGVSYFDGDVGIGTTGPSAKLHISTGATYEVGSLSGSILIEPTGVAFDGYGAGIVLGAGRGGRASGGAAIASVLDSASDPDRSGLSFFYHNATFGDPRTEGMRLAADGNVGIGTDSPVAKLSVVGSGENGGIFFNNSGAQEHRFYSSANSQFNTIGSSTPIWNWAQYTGVGVAPNYKMTLNNTGLGIGTTNPLHDLQIGDNGVAGSYSMMIEGAFASTALASNPRLNLIDTNFGITAGKYGSGGADDAIGIFAYQGAGRGILFAHTTAGSGTTLQNMRHDMFVDGGTGNVGIGTTSPGFKLEVDTNGVHDGIKIRGANAPGLTLQDDSSSSTSSILIQSTAAAQGNLRISADENNAANGATIEFKVSGGEKMRIDSSGNVGIGPSTTSPSHKLEVRDGTISGEIAKFSAIGATVVIESSTAGNAKLFLKPNTTGSKRGEFRVTDANDYGFLWTADTSANGTAYMELEASSTGGGDLTVKGDVIAYGSPSDKKYKENIKPIESALDKAMKLQGVTFDWKDNDSILDIKEDIGFIAQDVQEVLPELVRENKKGNLSLRYQGITPILLEAIKELKAEIEELKKQIK